MELLDFEKEGLANGKIKTFDYLKENAESIKRNEEKLAAMTPEEREAYLNAAHQINSW